MDTNLVDYFNASGVSSVYPYQQDLIVTLLLIIAFCQVIIVMYVLSKVVMK